MSEENVAVVTQAIEAFNLSDVDAFAVLTTVDFEWSPSMVAIEGTTFRGREGIERYFESLKIAWEKFHIHRGRFRHAEDLVVMLGRLEGRGMGSGVPVDSSLGMVFDFRGGMISRIRGYLDHAEALQAAGLSEQQTDGGRREMTTEAAGSPTHREPALRGQTVVLIGGSAGIGRETASRALAEGAEVVLAGRNPERLRQAASELGATSTATVDANDSDALERLFAEVEAPIDHVMVTAGGPYYSLLADMDFDEARRALQEHPMLMFGVARYAAPKVRPGGSLLFMGGTGGRRPGVPAITAAMTATLPALTAGLALEIAPVRVNLIAAGFVDTPLSASLLGDQLEDRRNELRTTLPIARVVGPEDVAALAVHLMINTALTGATYDIDGGQQVVPG